MNYSDKTVVQLKAMLKERGLSTAGLKAGLVKRLEKDDESKKEQVEKDDDSKKEHPINWKQIDEKIAQVEKEKSNSFTIPLDFKKYNFRAETKYDVYQVLQNKQFVDGLAYFKMTADPMFPDVDVEITSCHSLSQLQKMLKIPDGHVMVESLNYEEKYTGERWF